MITRKKLQNLYFDQGKSMQEIADHTHCSLNSIQYWMKKYGFQRRSISEAVYKSYHPNGSPFHLRAPKNNNEFFLFGMGLGLYWGEGNKASEHSVRLGNTDPQLIKVFISFLTTFFDVKRDRLRFGLQIFSDINVEEAERFWCKQLDVKKMQFYKSIVTRSVAKGPYRRKSKYGVLTVYFNNSRLKNILMNMITTEGVVK